MTTSVGETRPILKPVVETPKKTQSVDWKKVAIITAIALVAIVSVGLIAASIVATSGGSLAVFGIAAAFLGSQVGLGVGIGGVTLAVTAALNMACYLHDESAYAAQQASEEILTAVRSGNVETVRFLFTNRTISEADLASAVGEASRQGHEVIVRFLMSDNRKISEKDLGIAVNAASVKGHVDIIRFLLEGRTISPTALALAVFNATTKGREAVVRTLLDGRTISLGELNQAIKEARRTDNRSIHRFLEEQRPQSIHFSKELARARALA